MASESLSSAFEALERPNVEILLTVHRDGWDDLNQEISRLELELKILESEQAANVARFFAIHNGFAIVRIEKGKGAEKLPLKKFRFPLLRKKR